MLKPALIYVLSLSLICGCASRKLNAVVQDSHPLVGDLSEEQDVSDSQDLIERETRAEHALGDCTVFDLPFKSTAVYATPEGPAQVWTFSNQHVSRYRQANGMFPQTNFAIRLFMAEILARDPWLNFEKMESANPTEEQWMSVAKVMTLLHKQAGVQYSSQKFPLHETNTVLDSRIQGLMRGGNRGGLDLIRVGVIRLSENPLARSSPFDDLIRDTSDTQTQEARCLVIRVLTKMVSAFQDTAVRELNREWKELITTGEQTDRGQFVANRIRPKLRALFREKIQNPKERNALGVIWDGLF